MTCSASGIKPRYNRCGLDSLSQCQCKCCASVPFPLGTFAVNRLYKRECFSPIFIGDLYRFPITRVDNREIVGARRQRSSRDLYWLAEIDFDCLVYFACPRRSCDQSRQRQAMQQQLPFGYSRLPPRLALFSCGIKRFVRSQCEMHRGRCDVSVVVSVDIFFTICRAAGRMPREGHVCPYIGFGLACWPEDSARISHKPRSLCGFECAEVF